MSSRKVRIKKLNTKAELGIFTEDKIDLSEYESSAADNQIATGVEQAEENVRVHYPFGHDIVRYHVTNHMMDWARMAAVNPEPPSFAGTAA